MKFNPMKLDNDDLEKVTGGLEGHEHENMFPNIPEEINHQKNNEVHEHHDLRLDRE